MGKPKHILPDIENLPIDVIEGLQLALLPNGCFRVVDPSLRIARGQAYKKGYEARFVSSNQTELENVQRLLLRAGLKIGKPFAKGNQFVQPVYGREQLEWLLAVMQLPLDTS